MIEQNTEIIFNKKVTTDTFLMGLGAPEIAAEAMPGQFVMIQARTGVDPLLRRPFSICGIHGDDGFLILYRVVGRGTAIMSRAREGDALSVLGPLGRGFDLPQKGHKALLVAGGIGIAPLIFFAQTIKNNDLIFMAGYGSASEIVPIEQVGLGNMKVLIATDDGTAGYRGPVTEVLESHLAGPDDSIPTVFSCGPLPMLKRVVTITLNRGIQCQVSLETSMACGLGACQGCAVKSSSKENQAYYHVCKDGPVFDVNALNWKSI
jgi:dihydroorotate dehydrogenase electron transfer subunit